MSEEQKLAGVGASGAHEVQPVLGSWTRKSDGAPANLFTFGDYPLVGVCMNCNGPICAESFLSIWRHSENAV